MTRTLTTRAPDALAQEIEALAKDEQLDKSALIRRLLADAVEARRIAKALELYRDGKITIGKAAKIAKLSIWEMLDLLVEKGLHIDYGTEELAEDLKPLRRKLSADSQ